MQDLMTKNEYHIGIARNLKNNYHVRTYIITYIYHTFQNGEYHINIFENRVPHRYSAKLINDVRMQVQLTS